MYDIVCFLRGSCHFCIRRRIRYRIRRRMSNIRYRMSKIQYRISNIRYRIRHRIKCAISYVFVAGSCHFYIRRRIRYRIKKYDVVYDMQLLVAIIRYRTYISYASSLLYDIVRQNRKKHTILQYDVACDFPMVLPYDVACDFSTRTWTGVCGGSHWPCPWSADRSCLMILGPPRWSVLHCDSPDALSLSLACATANMSGDSLVQAKMGISS